MGTALAVLLHAKLLKLPLRQFRRHRPIALPAIDGCEAHAVGVGQFLLRELQRLADRLDRLGKVFGLANHGHWTSPADRTRRSKRGATLHR